MAGRVHSEDQRHTKPGQSVPVDLPLEITAVSAYVSRGGEKLQVAFEAWPISVDNAVCLDLGASTGGFTDCLLQHRAAQVYAVDVGYGQLAQRLRKDQRVAVMERTNARDLSALDPVPTLVALDLAFISVRAVLPVVEHVARPGADVVALVKPQFEADKEAVGRGGVVRDPRDRANAIAAVAGWAVGRGWRVGGVIASPLRGPAGNREFFLWLRTPAFRSESAATCECVAGEA